MENPHKGTKKVEFTHQLTFPETQDSEILSMGHRNVSVRGFL